jgi:DNA-binding GntR family transcriptional regulator
MSALDVPFRLDRARNATAQVFEYVRAQIVSLALKPGTVLREPRPELGKQLLDLVARQRGCLDAGDLENFTQIDMAFHKRMYEASELPDLWALMRSCSGNLDRLRRLHLPLNGKALAILRQHGQIARCVAQGDAAGAQRAVRHHLSGTLQALDVLRARFPDMLLPADYPPSMG